MTARELIKLAGGALIASGILATLGFSVHPHDSDGANHAMWIASHIVILSGFAVGLLGLVGLYAVVAEKTGIAGLAGFLVAALSLILYIGKLYWSGFIYPLVISQSPDFISHFGFNPGAEPSDAVVRVVFYLGPLLFGAGYALLGWTMLRARAFPVLPIMLMIVGALLVGLWPLLPAQVQHFSVVVSLCFTAGMTWIGFLLVRGNSAGMGMRARAG